MLLSVLWVASPKLDVDRLLAGQPGLRTDSVWHVGEPRGAHRTTTDNGFSLTLVDDEQEKTWAALVQRTLAELDRLRPLLEDIQKLGEVPEVDFGVSVGTREVFVRSCRFSADDLRRFVQLGVNVCVTAYPTTEE